MVKIVYDDKVSVRETLKLVPGVLPYIKCITGSCKYVHMSVYVCMNVYVYTDEGIL